MTTKVHGLFPIVGTEALTKNMQFYSVSVTEDIRPAEGATQQERLRKLIEVISMNGQPVIMGEITGTGPYVLKFAVEHENSWATAQALDDAITAHAGLTVTVTKGEVL